MRNSTPTYFKVRGKFAFPLDMLRYDECFPATTNSASKMEGLDRKDGRIIEREISLVSHRPNITEARWESFGWTVFWDHS